jgi:hypothetical protein
MRELIQKKTTQMVLLVLVAGIWLYNSWTILSMTTGGEAVMYSGPSDPGFGAELTLPIYEAFEYRATFNDPFRPKMDRISRQPVPVRQQVQVTEEIILPDLMLSGIVENMAIIRSGPINTFFVSVGDSVEGAVISSVARDSVVLIFKDTRFSLKLQN